MKKNKIKLTKLFKIGMLIFGISMLLWNCQDENIPLESAQEKFTFLSVSEKNARAVFNGFIIKQEKTLQKSSKNKDEILRIKPNWTTFIQENLTFTDALLSSVEVELNIKASLKTRLIFITLNNKILRILESKQISELKDNKIKEGYVYYHNLQGKFITGLKIENSLITKKLYSKKNVNKASLLGFISFFNDDCNENLDPNDIFCDNQINEVVITSNRNSYNSSAFTVIFGDGGGDDDSTWWYDNYFDNGGSGGGGDSGGQYPNNTCSGGKVYNNLIGNCECEEGYIDINGACVEEGDGPSCKSFNYVNTTATWQEAAVVNIRFHVYLYNSNEIRYLYSQLYSQSVLFGAPSNLANGGDVSAGIAAEISAKALNAAIYFTVKKFDNIFANETEVDIYFKNKLKEEFDAHYPGGRVQFNSTTNLRPTQYQTYAIFPDDCK